MNLQIDHFNIVQRLFFKIVRPFLSDKQYAQMSLSRWFGGGDINNPHTLNEKLQWLKLNFRDPRYSFLSDKVAARGFVAERIGAEYLNECIAIYKRPSDIAWSKLPQSFVMKATHGSGMNIIVHNRENLDRTLAEKQLTRWLAIDYSTYGREWQYAAIPRRIIVEKLLTDINGMIPQDFKVLCFTGVPRIIQVDVDRFGHHTRAYFDTNWERLPFTILYEQFPGEVARPTNLHEILDGARKLADGIPFVRVDFYALPKVVFGEMTFYPENGTGNFDKPEWDLRLGQYLKLPQKFR